MSIQDREGLIARIRQLRRLAASRDAPERTAPAAQPDRLEALEARVAHLEALLEGLQDSVHRESERHARLIAELQAQVRPEAMSASLARDARDRGL
ncbi:MAG TPA: hypothetical protein VKV27_13665 [Solirubrobacteraceae bacterium]|nr:hypothetical protein [Solirubrobacteraceae bacterium]